MFEGIGARMQPRGRRGESAVSRGRKSRAIVRATALSLLFTLGLPVALGALLSCAGGARVEDGGLVDREGWPVRPADRQLRCPEGTYLSDEIAQSGRRVARCQTFDTHNARGFELTWSAEGTLLAEMRLSEGGEPQKRSQWFESGEPSVEEVYEDGLLMRKVAWYPNGRVRAKVEYAPERGVTVVQRFGPDGSVEEEGELKDGQLVGEWREWKDGALERRTYVSGILQGAAERTFPAGGVERGRYENGRKVGKWIRVDDQGNTIREVEFVAGEMTGSYKLFHPTGQIREDGRYLDDEKHGRWRTWHPNGNLASEVWFSCGRPVGPYMTFDTAGNPEQIGQYEDGEKVGEWKKMTPTGAATQVQEFRPPARAFEPSSLPRQCGGD